MGNWKTCRLGDLITFQRGHDLPKTRMQGSTYPVVGSNGIIGYHDEYTTEAPSITIGRSGNVGKPFLYKGRSWSHNTSLYIREYKNVDPFFIYYFLQTLDLGSYAGGSAVPTLNRNYIHTMKVTVPADIEEQWQIGSVLTVLDEKIEKNTEVNGNLQLQAFALFERLLSQSNGSLCMLSEIAELNPKRRLAKDVIAKCIDMAQLSTSGPFPNGWEMKPYNGGIRFSNGDTIIARITPCLENGKTAFIDFLDDSEVAFGSTEYIVLTAKEGYPNEFFYCLARYPIFIDYAVKNMNGSSGRQRVSADTLGKYLLPRISEGEMAVFRDTVPALFRVMRNNSLENIRLSVLRDTLLPRLMSGELDVSELEL